MFASMNQVGYSIGRYCVMSHCVVMLSTNQYVHVYSFDFTKAFDSVRHVTLMDTMAILQIPDNAYNWINNFFGEHYHCTKFDGQCSTVAEVHTGF